MYLWLNIIFLFSCCWPYTHTHIVLFVCFQIFYIFKLYFSNYLSTVLHIFLIEFSAYIYLKVIMICSKTYLPFAFVLHIYYFYYIKYWRNIHKYINWPATLNKCKLYTNVNIQHNYTLISIDRYQYINILILDQY